jgi:predicted GNAT superfamily acetyltransferase
MARISEKLTSGKSQIITSTKEVESIKGEETRAINENYIHFVESRSIAIEIPVNWTTIQGNNIQLAQEWRGITDNIFQEYIGTSEGKYMITDVVTIKKGVQFRELF